MKKEKFVGKVTNIADETGEVRKSVGVPAEAFEGLKYIRIDFTFNDENMKRRTGLVQLMFEEHSYENNSYKIPRKGSEIVVLKKWFIRSYYKVDIPGLNKYINLIKVE